MTGTSLRSTIWSLRWAVFLPSFSSWVGVWVSWRSDDSSRGYRSLCTAHSGGSAGSYCEVGRGSPLSQRNVTDAMPRTSREVTIDSAPCCDGERVRLECFARDPGVTATDLISPTTSASHRRSTPLVHCPAVRRPSPNRRVVHLGRSEAGVRQGRRTVFQVFLLLRRRFFFFFLLLFLLFFFLLRSLPSPHASRDRSRRSLPVSDSRDPSLHQPPSLR